MLETETGIYLKTNRGKKCGGVLPNVALFNSQLGYHDRFWTLHSVKKTCRSREGIQKFRKLKTWI